MRVREELAKKNGRGSRDVLCFMQKQQEQRVTSETQPVNSLTRPKHRGMEKQLGNMNFHKTGFFFIRMLAPKSSPQRVHL